MTKKKDPKDHKKDGPKPIYNPKLCEKACEYAVRGATIREIAELFGVTEKTIYSWKHEHPEFGEALKLGNQAANGRVVESLYRRAVGYSFDAVKIMQYEGKPVVVPYVEHVPPDLGAAKMWLTNRDPENWREKSEVEHTGSAELLAALKARRERAAQEG